MKRKQNENISVLANAMKEEKKWRFYGEVFHFPVRSTSGLRTRILSSAIRNDAEASMLSLVAGWAFNAPMCLEVLYSEVFKLEKNCLPLDHCTNEKGMYIRSEPLEEMTLISLKKFVGQALNPNPIIPCSVFSDRPESRLSRLRYYTPVVQYVHFSFFFFLLSFFQTFFLHSFSSSLFSSLFFLFQT